MSSTNSPETCFFLNIERGRTQHPQRPIDTDRYLIGAGSNCHLQLGGEFPILHSVILMTTQGLWIDAVVSEPPLVVNQKQVRESALRAGDLIEIGEFVFVVEEKKQMSESLSNFDMEDENVDLSELSAEDLVDLLDLEMQTVESLESARQAGADALLKAISQLREENEPGTEEQKLHDISAIADQLERRTQELDQRESVLEEKAKHLEAAQARLEQYLQQLTQQAKQGPQGDGDQPIRKTA